MSLTVATEVDPKIDRVDFWQSNNFVPSSIRV